MNRRSFLTFLGLAPFAAKLPLPVRDLEPVVEFLGKDSVSPMAKNVEKQFGKLGGAMGHAKNQIANITKEQLGVYVGNFFLPDSEIQFGVNWRNVKRIEFSIYAVDLTKDLELTEGR